MITTEPFPSVFSQVPGLVPALSSITPQQVDTIARTIQATGRTWYIQTSGDYDGYLSILIEPRVGDEQKTFFVSGTAHCLELAHVKDDDMTSIGSFTGVEELNARLLDLMGKQ